MALKMIGKSPSAPQPAPQPPTFTEAFAQKAAAVLAPPQVDVEPVVAPQKVLVVPTESVIETMTAEYIELYKKYDYFEVKAMLKRMDEIRKNLLAIANETMPDKAPAVFSCSSGELEFSARGTTSEVTEPLALVTHLIEKFGPDVAASVVDIALTPLRKILSEHELEQHLTTTPGSRTLRSVRPAG